MEIKSILFDLDGTLANTLPLCIKVYKQTFQRYTGRSFSDDEITAHFGLTETGIMKRILPEQWEEGLKHYHDLYEQWHTECSKPFEGVDRALSLLQQRGIAMAVVTGKGLYTAQYTLKYLGLAHYFSTIEAGQENSVAKEQAIRKILASWQMDPTCAAYIGDTDSDIKEAAAAGVMPLAACWAETATIGHLDTMKPAATFMTVASFIDWIETHIATSKS